MPFTPKPLMSMLLVEPDSLMRGTVAGVTRSLGLAELHQSSTYASAEAELKTRRFDGLILALADDGEGLQLIEALRSGATRCAADCPVAVMTARCDTERALALSALKVRRIILKPFKVKTVLETVMQLAPSHRA